jgi:hypothetical protein
MIGKLGAESNGQISEIYFFVNRTIQLWNQLLPEALGTVSYKPSNLKELRK